MLTKAQIEVHHDLYRHFRGIFCDPKYSPANKQQQHIEKLKDFVRANWHRRADFPPWVTDWTKIWVSETKTPSSAGQ